MSFNWHGQDLSIGVAKDSSIDISKNTLRLVFGQGPFEEFLPGHSKEAIKKTHILTYLGQILALFTPNPTKVDSTWVILFESSNRSRGRPNRRGYAIEAGVIRIRA